MRECISLQILKNEWLWTARFLVKFIILGAFEVFILILLQGYIYSFRSSSKQSEIIVISKKKFLTNIWARIAFDYLYQFYINSVFKNFATLQYAFVFSTVYLRMKKMNYSFLDTINHSFKILLLL